MTLYQELQKALSEEDVKDIYIKYLKLKSYNKNLIDIQTKEIWFEAKHKATSIYEMFTQLFFYVKEAMLAGEKLAPFLAVVDSQKAAIMETKHACALLNNDKLTQELKWGKSASKVTPQALDVVSRYIGSYFVSYYIEHNEKEFIEAIHKARFYGELMRTAITPNNLRKVFDEWVRMIGGELEIDTKDYALLFYADIMHDGKQSVITDDEFPSMLFYNGDRPIFLLNAKQHRVKNLESYHAFWQRYTKPPKQEDRAYLLERRDSLIPTEERAFQGDYYTPLTIVEKAYDLLDQQLGADWQQKYVLWDMCCGVGNLETKHNYPRNIYMSTLRSHDIDIMRTNKSCIGAEIFQYDYLNDDIDDNGSLNYSLTNKLPISLQQLLAEGKKQLLVLINPPYAEAGSALGSEGKIGVSSDTKVAKNLMGSYGQATNELFTQFMVRLQHEYPSAKLAMFSKLKHVNAPNFATFRANFKAAYLGGFVVHSKAFDGLKGNFPVGFLLWDFAHHDDITTLTCDVLDKTGAPVGSKNFYNLPTSSYLNVWLDRPKADSSLTVVSLKNAVSVATLAKPFSSWRNDAIAYIMSKGNDLQNASRSTSIFSSAYGNGHGFYVTPSNLLQAATIFAVRRLIAQTWLNDRDQFLQPNQSLPTEFTTDCLVYMLFSGSNLTASANGLEWAGKQWSIVNHFIPYTEAQVGANARFQSSFMVDFMQNLAFSPEAQAMLEAGQKLWGLYFSTLSMSGFEKSITDAYSLNRPDVGYYQICSAIKKKLGKSHLQGTEEAFAILSAKLRPRVYDYGFLKC